jgi:hypothetical protein
VPAVDRDRVVEQLLKGAAGDLLAGPGPDCVDAEALAAWSDGGLDTAGARRIERHLATCGHCQAMLAAFARAGVEVPAPGRVTWGRRWLVPIGVAAAAAAAIWVLVPRRAPSPAVERSIAMNEPPAPAPPPPEVSLPPKLTMPEGLPSSFDGQLDYPSMDKAASAKASAAATPAPAASPLPVATPAAPSALPAPPAPVTSGAPLIQAQSGERSFAVSSTQTENLPVSRGTFPGVTAMVPGGAAAEGSSREARPGGAGQNNVVMDGISAADVVAPARVVSEFVAGEPGGVEPGPGQSAVPDGAVPEPTATAPPTRWRVLADGRVQRSLTAGAAWDAMAIDASLRLTAGSAPSPMVCWLVGPSGVVLRATDRLHFERLTFPEMVDLVAVRAVNGQDASVTTRDGRVFATSDGGTTWRAAAR